MTGNEMEFDSVFLDLILQKMPGHVLLFKDDPKHMPVFDINDSLLEKLKYERKNFLKDFGRSSFSLFSEDSLIEIKRTFEKASEEENVSSIEIQLKTSDEQYFWFSCRLSLLPDFQKETLILAVCEDINELKEKQAQVEEKTYLISKTKVELIQELEYERFLKQITNELYENFFEADLTNNKLLSSNSRNSTESKAGEVYDVFIKKLIQTEICADSRKECLKTYSREHLISEYKKGNMQISMQCLATGNSGESFYWLEINCRVFMHPATNTLRCVVYSRNIDEAKRQEIGLLEKAQQDSLTMLFNKRTVETLIEDVFKSSAKNSKHALIMLDLDNFKKVNDSLGHVFGDKVLVEFSQEMRKSFREGDILGRIGGDEFVILVKNYGHIDTLKKRVLELCSRLVKTYDGRLEKYSVSASVGVALYPENGRTYKELQSKADNALYFSKGHGKNTFTFFSNELNYINSYLFHERDIDVLINSSTDGIGKYAFDDKLSILYYNSKLLNLFGFDDRGLEQEQLSNTLEYVHKDDRTTFLHVLNEALMHKSIFSHTYRIVNQRDGHLVHVRVKGMFTEELHNNALPVFYLLYTDVSDLARQNEIISMQQKEISIVNDMTDDLIYEYDMTTGHFSMLGNEYADLTKGIVQSASAFIHFVQPDDLREYNQNIIFNLFKQPKDLFVNEVMLHHNEKGELPVVVYGKHVVNQDGTNEKIIGKIASREAEVKAKQELALTKRLMASLNNISTLLISSELGSFDERLSRTLAVIASALDIDAVSIWQIDYDDDNERYSVMLYQWLDSDMPKNNSTVRLIEKIYREEYERWFESMCKNKPFSIGIGTSKVDKEFLQRQGLFSLYSLPIHIDGTLWGYLELGDAKELSVFNEQQVSLLKMYAQLITLSIRERMKLKER